MNIRIHGQHATKLPHKVFPGPLGVDLETSVSLNEKLQHKSIQRSLFLTNHDLQGRRHRRSLSITHSFDVLRSRLLNTIKMGNIRFGENTDQNREKKQGDRGGLKDIG